MPREYRHIKQYEKELFKLKEKGLTHKEIGAQLGFTSDQVKKFFERHRNTQRKLNAGITIKPKGRPRKDGTKLPPSIQQLSKLSQMQYELASKDRYIKRLEMENELLRDFLLLTERK